MWLLIWGWKIQSTSNFFTLNNQEISQKLEENRLLLCYVITHLENSQFACHLSHSIADLENTRRAILPFLVPGCWLCNISFKALTPCNCPMTHLVLAVFPAWSCDSCLAFIMGDRPTGARVVVLSPVQQTPWRVCENTDCQAQPWSLI